MRISDWSSDVCSSDLLERRPRLVQGSRGGVALYRPGQADAEWLRRELQRSDARRAAQRDPVPELGPCPGGDRRWAEDYNQERPHSSLGYESPAAFAAELHKQWPASLRPTGSADPTS